MRSENKSAINSFLNWKLQVNYLRVSAVAFLTLILFGCAQEVEFALPSTTQAFGQKVTYNSKVDILWVIDNSTSMGPHQSALSAQVPALVDRLSALKMDYHMGVVTTTIGPNGEGAGFVGSPNYYDSKNYQTLDQIQSLKNNFTMRIQQGENGGNIERGLGALMGVLQPNYLNNEGRGFFRDDALLVMIILSDEEDQSSLSTTAYKDFFNQLKQQVDPKDQRWILNFIGVLADNTACKVMNESSSVGSRYMELVAASKGIQRSVCSADLTAAVSDIKARIESVLTDFRLGKKPDVTTLKIWINGKEVPESTENGWTYIPETNSIHFSGSYIPPADADIKIDFTPAGVN